MIYIVYWCILNHYSKPCEQPFKDDFGRVRITFNTNYCYDEIKDCNNEKFISFRDAESFYLRAKSESGILDVKIDSVNILKVK